jgi:hypothetical protein
MSAELAQTDGGTGEELNATSVLSNKEERELVWRRVFIGQSQREVAKDMDTGKGTVSKVLTEYRSINDGDLEKRIIDEFEGFVEPYGTRSAETIRAELVRDVYTVRQYREAKSAGADLGLSVSDNDFFGSWQSDDGHPVFLRGGETVEKVGQKYLHVRADGELIPVEPTDGASGRGRVRITFN